MTEQYKLGACATHVGTEENHPIMGTCHYVQYHQTKLVRWNPDQIMLDSAGWYTPTTKTRLNQASNSFGLGYRVYQKAGSWYVEYKGETLPFINGMILER